MKNFLAKVKKLFKVPQWYIKHCGKWNYLGYTRISFTDPKSKEEKVTERNTIHFWGKGEDLIFRKITNFNSSFKHHPYYQEQIVPWVVDSKKNVYAGIMHPSDWFQEYTKKENGYEWIDEKWVKPAPKVQREGNVLSIVKNDDKK